MKWRFQIIPELVKMADGGVEDRDPECAATHSKHTSQKNGRLLTMKCPIQ